MTAVDSVGTLADRLLDRLFAAEPLGATGLGVPGYDDRLGDPSPAGDETLRADLLDVLARSEAAVPADVNERITLTAVRDTATRGLLELDVRAGDHTVTAMPLSGPPALFATVAVTTLRSEQAAADLVSRLRASGEWIDAVGERLQAGTAAGRRPVASLVAQAIGWVDAQLAEDLPGALAGPIATAPESTRAELTAVARAVTLPAVARYRDVLLELLPGARPDEQAGIGAIPGGGADYERAVQIHTTLPLTPDELHQAGLAEIERLTARASEIGARLGLPDLAAVRSALLGAAAGIDPDQSLAAARAAVARAEAASVGLLPPPANPPCAVTPMPDAVADSGMAPHYTPPGAGGRPGTYWFNTRTPTAGTAWDLEGVAFHEAVPGHHLHLARIPQLPGLPALQSRLPITVHAEGWGLYSEQLAEEMGLYSGDEQLLGATFLQMHRAARLVVDTGLHHYGWSRERAAAFLIEHVALSEGFLRAETDRYIAWPGQALAYQTGKTEILRLRADARARLGDAFDLQGFHSAVIDHGMLPMPALAAVVESWIAASS